MVKCAPAVPLTQTMANGTGRALSAGPTVLPARGRSCPVVVAVLEKVQLPHSREDDDFYFLRLLSLLTGGPLRGRHCCSSPMEPGPHVSSGTGVRGGDKGGWSERLVSLDTGVGWWKHRHDASVLPRPPLTRTPSLKTRRDFALRGVRRQDRDACFRRHEPHLGGAAWPAQPEPRGEPPAVAYRFVRPLEHEGPLQNCAVSEATHFVELLPFTQCPRAPSKSVVTHFVGQEDQIQRR